MRKLIGLLIVLTLVVPAFGVMAQGDDFDCGTTEDVVITYYGDPAGSHPAAEQATIAAFKELCPNINVLRIDGSANTTEVLATYLQQFEAQSGDVAGLTSGAVKG